MALDVDNRLYEVLPPCSADTWNSARKLKKTFSSSSVPNTYNTYAVPRGVNGTPPTCRAIPPAVPPRNRNVSEGEGPSSQGSSPTDKGALFSAKGKGMAQGTYKRDIPSRQK